MLWTIVTGAAAGGVSGGLAALVFRGPEKKMLRLGVTVGGMVLMSGLAQEFLVKPHEADVALQQVRVFSVLKEREPETYAAIRADMMKEMDRGHLDDEALRARVRAQLGPLTRKYIPLASDEALHRYMSVVVSEIDQLRARDPVLARKFLWPAQGEALDIRPYIDAATQQADIDALSQLIETGAGSKPHADDAQRADELLHGAVTSLSGTYGKDLALLSRATAPDTDAAKVTAILADLYRAILAMPVPDSTMVLRKVLASG